MGAYIWSVLLAAGAWSQPAPLTQDETARIAAQCVEPGLGERPMAELTPGQIQAIVACAMRNASVALNRQLPLRIDEITILESTTVDGTTLSYNGRIDLGAGEIVADAPQRLERASRTYVCSQADMVQTMSFGGAYAYSWVDREGAPVHRFVISGC